MREIYSIIPFPINQEQKQFFYKYYKKTAAPIWGTAGKALIKLIFESEIIRDHRNKFAIGRLSSIVLNGVPKIGIERIHIPSVPRDLDGVADGEKSIGLFIGLNTLYLLSCPILAYYNHSVKRQTYEDLKTKNEQLTINYPTGNKEERIKKRTSLKKLSNNSISTFRTHE